MNCEQFKEKILHGDDSSELKEHLESCKLCHDWINSEIKNVPEGVASEKWNTLIQSINKNDVQDKDNGEVINSDVNTSKEKTFLDYYLSGLKYGIVFGIAIVVGFAIIQSRIENTNVENIDENANITASDTVIIYENSIATDTIK